MQTLYVKYSRIYHVSTIMLFHLLFVDPQKLVFTNIDKFTVYVKVTEFV